MTITAIRPGALQAASPSLSKAVMDLVDAKGLDVFSAAKRLEYNAKIPKAVSSALETFAGILGNVGGSDLLYVATLKVGGETVYVATDNDFDHNRELVGFFDASGRSLARAFTLYDKDVMRMAWSKDGKPGQQIQAAPIAKVSVSSSFKNDLEAYAAKKDDDGEDYGKQIATDKLPAPVRHRMEMMERTIADPTGSEVFQLNGTTVYMLGDYSCVSSKFFVTADGKKHFEIVG